MRILTLGIILLAGCSSNSRLPFINPMAGPQVWEGDATEVAIAKGGFHTTNDTLRVANVHCQKFRKSARLVKSAGPLDLPYVDKFSCVSNSQADRSRDQIKKKVSSRSESDLPNPLGMTDSSVCEWATKGSPKSGSWTTWKEYRQYVREAKTRKLSCGIRDEISQNKNDQIASAESTNETFNLKTMSFNPESVEYFYCKNNDGLFGGMFGANRTCADSLTASCKAKYPKVYGRPLSYVRALTCWIKSGDHEFANNDQWKFDRPFNVLRRAHYLMAHQGLITFEQAHSEAEIISSIHDEQYDRWLAARRQRGLNMMLLGSCFASHGVQNCLSSGGSYQRQIDGFLTSSTLSGVNRVCAYDEVGSRRTITVSASQLCPLSLNKAKTIRSRPSSGVAILKNSYVSGLNKVCIYRDGVSGFVTTVGATDICAPTQ